MKIQRTTFKKPLLIAAAIAVILLGALGIAYALDTWPFQSKTEDQAINLEEPAIEQIKDGEETKERVIEESSTPGSNETATKEPAREEPSRSNDELETSITVAEVNDDTVYIRNEIRGVYNTGSCKLTLIRLSLNNDGDTVTKTAGVQALAQVSTCKGFNVPVSELSQGSWKVSLEVSINGKTDTATSEVTI